ncbi:hypothetical protein Sgleb_73030 [Streptomyces glebosus]|uniref:Uncharacterized protein n=1 Tax=Streptomyces glebosus TaxID=249580 RepID=A0A640TAE2_9ACTN|nr:hypothetical protein Sgleb_73030 [Streptomyces glebosus]GHG78974.1 hypothetical protein GCM10010513_55920 [Streptomyces glebosus]
METFTDSWYSPDPTNTRSPACARDTAAEIVGASAGTLIVTCAPGGRRPWFDPSSPGPQPASTQVSVLSNATITRRRRRGMARILA